VSSAPKLVATPLIPPHATGVDAAGAPALTEGVERADVAPPPKRTPRRKVVPDATSATSTAGCADASAASAATSVATVEVKECVIAPRPKGTTLQAV
jgi:hypothetical protein